MTNLFTRVLVVGLMALATSCVPNDSSIRIIGSYQSYSKTGTDCDFSGVIQQGWGIYDLAATPFYEGNVLGPVYKLAIGVESQLLEYEVLAAGKSVGGQGANTFITDSVSLEYSSSSPELKPLKAILEKSPDSYSAHWTMTAGSTDNRFIVSMLGPKVLSVLTNGLGGTKSGDLGTLDVKLSLKGHLYNGMPLTSNVLTFPIKLWNSATAPLCGPGTLPSSAPAPTMTDPTPKAICASAGQDNVGGSCVAAP